MSSTLLITFSRMFAVAALILATVGGYQLFAPTLPPGHLAVDRTAMDFGALPLGEHRIVVARVTNTGGRPASILGVPESCGRGTCYAPVDQGPRVVPPGETVDIDCVVTLRTEGPVGFQVQLYLDNGTFERVDVQVSGSAISSQRGKDGVQRNQP